MTASTEDRIYRALTPVGRQKFHKLCQTRTPKEALRRIIVEDRADTAASKQRSRDNFIEHGWPLAKMSVEEFQRLDTEALMNRWHTHPVPEQRRILKCFGVKTSAGLRAVYADHAKAHWLEEFLWAPSHLDNILRAKELGLTYNEEAYDAYRSIWPKEEA